MNYPGASLFLFGALFGFYAMGDYRLSTLERLHSKYVAYDYLYIDDLSAYRIKSPRGFRRAHGGVCYDYVVVLADELENAGIPYRCYYTVVHRDDKTIATHTYIIVAKYWLECSWKSREGLHEVSSFEDVEAELLEYYSGDSSCTVEYDPLDTVGMPLKKFYAYLFGKSV